MKLLTELKSYLVPDTPPRFVEDPEGTLEQIRHDAAAAHALMQALTLELPMPHLMAVKAKADELMRQWGYEE